MGLPIPHTALIPRNKDRIGAGLGSFVDRNFLAPDLLVKKLRTLDPAAIVGHWLARPGSAQLVADRIVVAVPVVINSIDDEEVRGFFRHALRRPLDSLDPAPLQSKAPPILTDTGHQPALERKNVVEGTRWHTAQLPGVAP